MTHLTIFMELFILSNRSTILTHSKLGELCGISPYLAGMLMGTTVMI